MKLEKKNIFEEVDNSIEFVEMKYKLKRYEGLLEFGQLTASSLDFKNIQKKAATKIKKLIECEKVVIYRIDEKTDEIYNQRFINEQLIDSRFDINEHSFVGSCAHYSAVLHIKDAKSDIRLKKEPEFIKELEVKNILLVPLVSKGEILGVLQFINSLNDDFNSEDIQFSEAVANQLTIAIENAILFEKNQKQFLQIVEAMADAIGKKDAYTGGHTRRVGIFAEMIAKELSLTFEEMNDLKLSAVLHDIGKIGIEDKILKKAAPLTEEEFKVMKNHPRIGDEILGHIESLSNVVAGVKYHHERPDGKGYPYGLKGDEIPQISMIISVADTFDAMISNRPYRKGLPPMVAYEEIKSCSGTQFSTDVVDAFVKAFEKSKMFRPQKLSFSQKAS
jgi:HD-GYP domain-containing protein (c-di-GMP phosphodiesterase class II)